MTKSKTWKDIAGLLGIGASSSAAYTLRKHYTKNLLAFECHFDRGDIDPLPIIQQVEAGSKKKTTKAASVPSPGKCLSSDFVLILDLRKCKQGCTNCSYINPLKPLSNFFFTLLHSIPTNRWWSFGCRNNQFNRVVKLTRFFPGSAWRRS